MILVLPFVTKRISASPEAGEEDGSMTPLQELIEELHTLDQELAHFEHKYGLLSETFFNWYQSGEEPEDPDWVQDFAIWAGTYQLKLRRQEQYRRLVAEALAQRDVSALMRESSPVGASG